MLANQNPKRYYEEMIKRFLSGFLASILVIASCDFGIEKALSTPTCNDIKFIWVNGSGATINGTDNNYLDFRHAIETELAGTSVTYDFYELGTEPHRGHQYPAKAIGVDSFDNFSTMLGAYLSAGESYSYGHSVDEGVAELKAYIAESAKSCPKSRFVIGGLSQGAEVISEAMLSDELKSYTSRILYVATFGDPKLYLPEGKGGKRSTACKTGSRSEYRAYVPDCWVEEGILGGRVAYTNGYYLNKIGAYCNHNDVVCTGRLDIFNLKEILESHGSYGNSYFAYRTYERAARTIYNRIAAAWNANDLPSSTGVSNVAILIDGTASMQSVIDSYKSEAYRLAREIWAKGGEVALYEYRDIHNYNPFSAPVRKLCGFSDEAEPCTNDNLAEKLDGILCVGGGDAPESALAASWHAMNSLSWGQGATKSMIILTDNTYHDSEVFENTTLTDEKVAALSASIDPVQIYTLTPAKYESAYTHLTSLTGGQTFSLEDEISLSTTSILESGQMALRPELSEEPQSPEEIEDEVLPEITNLSHEIIDDELKISFTTDASAVLVIINDTVLGYTTETSLTVADLDFSVANQIRLVPYSRNGFKGSAKEILISATSSPVIPDSPTSPTSDPTPGAPSLPTTPDCGKAE